MGQGQERQDMTSGTQTWKRPMGLTNTVYFHGKIDVMTTEW